MQREYGSQYNQHASGVSIAACDAAPVKPFMHSGVCIIGSLAIFKRVWEDVRRLLILCMCACVRGSVSTEPTVVRQEFARARESNRMNNILRIHHTAAERAEHTRARWLVRKHAPASSSHAMRAPMMPHTIALSAFYIIISRVRSPALERTRPQRKSCCAARVRILFGASSRSLYGSAVRDDYCPDPEGVRGSELLFRRLTNGTARLNSARDRDLCSARCTSNLTL